MAAISRRRTPLPPPPLIMIPIQTMNAPTRSLSSSPTSWTTASLDRPPHLARHQLMTDDMAAVLRRRQQQLQLAPSLFWAEQHNQEPPPNDVFFFIKIFCCIAAVFLAGVTSMVALRLPREYTTKGGGQLLIMCPILFGGFALSWLMIDKLDRDEKRKTSRGERLNVLNGR